MHDEQVFASEVHFSGHVQGVGFRYATRRIAMEFEVTGRVRNLADGRVCLEVEGSELEVEAFLQAVVQRMGDFIRKVERQDHQRHRRFADFAIDA